MASIPAILKLIRLPNLIIVAATLYGFRFLVIGPYYALSGTEFQLSSSTFMLMVAIALLIASAGYVINDYYDLDIDRINRPDRPAVTGKIKRSSLPFAAIFLSILALGGITALCFEMDSLFPIPIPLVTLVTVWWYALHLKKSFLWGNLVVSIMSAFTLGTAWLFEWFLLVRYGKNLFEIKAITLIVSGIMVFAFLLSLLREIVKDMEDMEGDKLYGCKSMPIINGIQYTRNFIRTVSLLLFVSLFLSQYWLLGQNFKLVAFWLMPAVEIPLLIFMLRLKKAATPEGFHRLSSLLKYIMIGGIASMGVIWLNFQF